MQVRNLFNLIISGIWLFLFIGTGIQLYKARKVLDEIQALTAKTQRLRDEVCMFAPKDQAQENSCKSPHSAPCAPGQTLGPGESCTLQFSIPISPPEPPPEDASSRPHLI